MTSIIAHRGFAGVNPENTVAAVRAAAPDAHWVEIDVVACADGTPVVFHDAHLHSAGESRGITDGTGAVHDLPPETVTAAEVLESGETVPTLARLVAATDAPLNVELKRAGGRVWRGVRPAADRDAARGRWQPFVDRVFDALDGRDVLFSSFAEGALAAVRERDGAVPLAPLCLDVADGRELADRYDADRIHPPYSVIGDADLRATDHAVNVWTIRTRDEAREAIAAGADGLIADAPGLIADAP